MDMNWLWTYSETMKMCNDNLRQAVAFMDEFPDYTMLQSQAAVYNFVEKVDPPLFKLVQKYVKEGRLGTGRRYVDRRRHESFLGRSHYPFFSAGSALFSKSVWQNDPCGLVAR